MCIRDSRYFPGTIAYLRFWHGEALDADQVAELYALRIDPTSMPTPAPTADCPNGQY